MKVSKQAKAFWRALGKHSEKWEAEAPITDKQKAYGQWLRTKEREQGYATGWIDGVNWARRNTTKKKSP